MIDEPTKPIATSADGAGMEQASTTETPPKAEAGKAESGNTGDADAEADRLGDFA